MCDQTFLSATAGAETLPSIASISSKSVNEASCVRYVALYNSLFIPHLYPYTNLLPTG